LPGDLPQAWIGIYNILPISKCNADAMCKMSIPKIQLLIGGSGKNFVWSADDKTIIYEADLGLSGLMETRTIDSVTGEILERKNTPVNDSEIPGWITYKNTGFKISLPANWGGEEGYDEEYNKGEFGAVEIRNVLNSGEWINIRKFETKSGQSFKDILVENTYLGETGPDDNVHPDFADFEMEKVGNNNFYYIFPYLSEGQYSISYWYVKESILIQLELHALAEGDWQNSSWQIENQSAYKIFNQILSTFKFIEPEK